MRYEATVDSDSLAMFDRKTGTMLDAVAVIPSHAPDLAALVDLVPPEFAGELARLAAWRALGMDAPLPADFEV